MKYRQFHALMIKAGWKYSHSEGSHQFYIKDGVLSEPIPFHGGKEIGKGLASKIIKRYGLK